jgi:hypothetical protein
MSVTSQSAFVVIKNGKSDLIVQSRRSCGVIGSLNKIQPMWQNANE